MRRQQQKQDRPWQDCSNDARKAIQAVETAVCEEKTVSTVIYSDHSHPAGRLDGSHLLWTEPCPVFLFIHVDNHDNGSGLRVWQRGVLHLGHSYRLSYWDNPI